MFDFTEFFLGCYGLSTLPFYEVYGSLHENLIEQPERHDLMLEID